MSSERDALEDMVWQFAHRGRKGHRLILGTGGLSALEGAFVALGWDDPHFVSSEMNCEVSGCFEWATCGGGVENTEGWYLQTCGPTNHRWQEPVTPKQRVANRERHRCKTCGWLNLPEDPAHHDSTKHLLAENPVRRKP